MNVIVKVRFQGDKEITLTGEHGNKKSLVSIIETLITAKQIKLERAKERGNKINLKERIAKHGG